MIDWKSFSDLLSRYAKAPSVSPDEVLFRGGLNISSIAFTEFIMELEEVVGYDIDIDDLDESIRTAGDLYERLSAS